MKKYFQMSKTERELIVKLIWCTVFSTLFSWAIGDLYSPTTAVTANLVLYIDRGYRGSLRYAFRRVLVQVVQGIFVLAFILPFKYLGAPVHDVVLLIVACCLSLVIGLPINYKNQYSPYNCTLANASFIVACIGIQSLQAFPRRVLECIVGGIIAYFVNYIIFPHRDRIGEILKNTYDAVLDMTANSSGAVYKKNLEVISKDIGYLVEDSQKGLKRLKVSEEKIGRMLSHKKLMTILYDYTVFFNEHKQKFSAQFEQALQAGFQKAAALHLSLFEENGGDTVDSVEVPVIETGCPAELSMLGRLAEYISALDGAACKAA